MQLLAKSSASACGVCIALLARVRDENKACATASSVLVSRRTRGIQTLISASSQMMKPYRV
jgi:hypothetical protein